MKSGMTAKSPKHPRAHAWAGVGFPIAEIGLNITKSSFDVLCITDQFPH